MRQIDSLTERQIEQLWRLFQEEWWTAGRSLEDVRRMVTGCDIIIAFEEQQSSDLIGFARVLTDFVYKAFVFDVIVRADYRREGLGSRLMNQLCEHPLLKPVQHIELYCRPELLPFYSRWRFWAIQADLRFLRREKQYACR